MMPLSSMANGNKIETRRHPLSHVEIYEVTSDELDRIESEAKTVGQDFQYASNCLTGAVAFSIAIFETEIKSERTYDTFLILAISGFVFALYFGQRYFRGKRRCATVIQRIRERQIGPVGEEGRELRPGQVAQLPAVAAPASPEAAPGAATEVQAATGTGS